MPSQRQNPAPEPRKRWFRLRHVLLLAGVGLLLNWLLPRVNAAFELHSKATAAANYGACMVGPTGPSLLRDNPNQFSALVRRRLITATASSAPFAECAALAEEVSGSVDTARAHRLHAVEFVEFGGPNASAQGSLEQLHLSLSPLARLAKAAWPLERNGYAQLVQPASHAKEAPHPVALNTPAVGSGLPGGRALYNSTWSRDGRHYLASGSSGNLAVYESEDAVRWQKASLNRPGVMEHAGRCVAPDAERSFSIEFGESRLVVNSLFADSIVAVTRSEQSSELLALSCDATAALLVVSDEQQKRRLVLCAHGGRCGELSHLSEWLDGNFDVARVSGTNVIATTRAGIVRVRSSRDDGRSWTPDTVAFDWLGNPSPSDVKVPTRLLAVGNELLLYGAAKPGQTYPLLASLDMGTSWHAPAPAKAQRLAPRPVSPHPAAPGVALHNARP